MTAYCDHGTAFSGSCASCAKIERDAAAGFDVIDKPAHYTQGAIECIDAIEAALGRELFVGFLRGQILKYAWRCGLKDAPAQEAGKLAWYAAKLVAVLP